MEQSINDRAMDFTKMVEAFLRGDSDFYVNGGRVTETSLIDAMYGLRAAIERDEQRQRETIPA